MSHHQVHALNSLKMPLSEKSAEHSQMLLNKLIAGYNHLPVERRKAVTIGFNRWLKPLTIQVPDVISNLLPSSSNLIKVHDSPKNQSKKTTPSQSDMSNLQTNPLLQYDPMQLFTNFEQNNPLLQSLANSPQALGFANSNGSFGFDESQLNFPGALFGTQNTPFTAPGHMSMMNDKPYQTVPMFEQDDSYEGHNAAYKRPQYMANGYGAQQGEQENLQHQQNQYSMAEEENQQDKEALRPSQSGGRPSNYDYYKRFKPHFMNSEQDGYNYNGRAPSVDSGNSEKTTSLFEKDRERLNTFMNSFNDNYNNEDSQRYNSPRGFYQNSNKENGESAFLVDQQSHNNTAKLQNDSPNRLVGNYYNPQMQQQGAEQGNPGRGRQPNVNEEIDTDEMDKLEQQQPDGENYNNFYQNSFHRAASMLNPVMLKNILPDGRQELAAAVDDKKTPNAPFLLPINLNGLPNGQQLKTTNTRPVAIRIKEFIKSMIQQRY